ncbi:MAG: shikimate dehydrogenase [Methylophilus sp.]|jgi:shikimate dehydrogenase
MTKKYAVIGNPIEHSKSPLIHQIFASQFGIEIVYERVLAPLGGFTHTLQDLIAQGYQGANVTVPFKFDAYHVAQQLKARAKQAGAANTLSFDSVHGVIADNTDGTGLVRDIQQNLGVAIKAKRVLLIGAGGAAEGVTYPLAENMPSVFVIANRSVDKALSIVQKLQAIEAFSTTDIKSSDFAGLDGMAFDIVINATSAGLSDSKLNIANTVFAPDSLAYDMMYGRETPFMAQARLAGARVADGLGMLVEQAAEAFYIWHGLRPDTQAAIDALRNGKNV